MNKIYDVLDIITKDTTYLITAMNMKDKSAELTIQIENKDLNTITKNISSLNEIIPNIDIQIINCTTLKLQPTIHIDLIVDLSRVNFVLLNTLLRLYKL